MASTIDRPSVIVFEPAPDVYSRTHLTNVLDTIRRALDQKLPRREAVDTIYLRSPNGQIWDVTVSNSGVLTVTAHAPNTPY